MSDRYCQVRDNRLWKMLVIAVTIQYGYWAVMFAGAWLNINTAPIVSPDWIALGFFGAAILMLEEVFPPLNSIRK